MELHAVEVMVWTLATAVPASATKIGEAAA